MRQIDSQTVTDFGNQWQRYPQNEGFYASLDLFRDLCEPLLDIKEIKDKKVLDIGSGTGRIVRMLIEASASHVTAVEPSDAYYILVNNTKDFVDKVKILHLTGDAIPNLEVELAFSIGVLHHILNPIPIVKRVFSCLKPGGKLLIWVYGREGNEKYLSIVQPLREITKKLPDSMLSSFAWILNFFLSFYIFICKFVKLPLYKYAQEVLAKLSWKHRYLVIFDQLNPAFSKYYSQEEAEELLQHAGFINVRSHHRHGYSWTVVGIKP